MNHLNRRAIAWTTCGLAFLFASGCTVRNLSVGVGADSHHDHYRPRVARVHIPPAHVCSYGCNDHYWDGRAIVVLDSGHHHGNNCGHHWDGGHWVVRARRHNARRIHHDDNHDVPRKVRVRRRRGHH